MCACRWEANASADLVEYGDRHCFVWRATFTVLEAATAQGQVPGTDGVLRMKTVIPVLAFGSFDNPECKKVTGVKDGYRQMAMFCSRCVARTVSGTCFMATGIFCGHLHGRQV